MFSLIYKVNKKNGLELLNRFFYLFKSSSINQQNSQVPLIPYRDYLVL